MAPPFTPPYSVLASFMDLCEHLREEGVAFSADPASQVVELPSSVAEVASRLFVRWDRHLPLVQLIQPIVADVDPDRLEAVDRCLSRLNHCAPVPGYAIDPDQRFAYFRIALQRDEHDKITVTQLARAVRSAVASAGEARALVVAAAAPPESAAAPASA